MFGIARTLVFAVALAGLAAGSATASVQFPGQAAEPLSGHEALREAASHASVPGDGPTIIIVQHQDSQQVIPAYGCAVNCRDALPSNREVNDRSLDRAHLFSQRAFDRNNPRAFFFFDR